MMKGACNNTFLLAPTPGERSNTQIQPNFGRSNAPVSNTRDRSNSFFGPGNFPIHLMLKYAQARTAMARTQSMVRRAIFHVKRYDDSNRIFLDMNQSHA